MTNATGQLISRHAYFPFGKEVPPLVASPSMHRFIAREWDSESDLLYMMARYYGAGQARFLSPDPEGDWRIGSPQSWNKYSYVTNNPLRYFDPSGEATQPVHRAMTEQVWAGMGDAVAAVDNGLSSAAFNPRGHFGGLAMADLFAAEAIDAARLGNDYKSLLAQAIHVVQDDVFHRDYSNQPIGWWEHLFRNIGDAFIKGCSFSPDCDQRWDFAKKVEKATQRTAELKVIWDAAMASNDWSEWDRLVKIKIRVDGPKIITPVGNDQTRNPMSPMQIYVDKVCIRGCGMGK